MTKAQVKIKAVCQSSTVRGKQTTPAHRTAIKKEKEAGEL